MAIMDQQVIFSDAQVVTATGASTNVVDSGVLNGYNTNFLGASIPSKTLGTGEQFVCLLEISAVSGTTPTLAAKLQGSTASAFGSPVDLDAFLSGVAVTPVANTQMVLDFSPRKPYQYYRLYYTVGGTTPSITITAGLVRDAQTSLMSQAY